MHTRGQGCIYEIYQYSVKKYGGTRGWICISGGVCLYEKQRKTGKAFRIKWLLLALVAAALIFVPAASHKVSAAKLVYTVKFNNNSGTSKSKDVYRTDTECDIKYYDPASGSTQGCGISESRMDHTEGEQ